MAQVICIKCGDTKSRALDACPACAFVPETAHDRAQSMVATTHHLSEAKLTALAAALMRGERVELPFEDVLAYMDTFEGRSEDLAPVPVPGKGCGWLVFTGVLVLLALIFLVSV